MNTRAYVNYVAKQVGCHECDPLPPLRVAPAVWMRIAWAMFEVEAGRMRRQEISPRASLGRDDKRKDGRDDRASTEKDAIFTAMQEGFEMAYAAQRTAG